jgi:phenylacetic acid degradation operon negative regulatory protein
LSNKLETKIGEIENLSTRTLVLGMITAEGVLEVTELYQIAELCGMTAQQVRLCLKRLVAEGILADQTGRGREAVFTTTEAGRALLEPDVEWLSLAYQQDVGLVTWDGMWHLVGFVIPESRRTARDTLREYLVSIGGAALQSGLYISPHPWETYVRKLTDELGVSENVTFIETTKLEMGGVSDNFEIAAKLWELDKLAARYQAFIEQYQPAIAELKTSQINDQVLFPAALAMIEAFDQCVRDDPLLPSELLPENWTGKIARRLLAQGRQRSLEVSPLLRCSSFFRAFDGAIQINPTG